MISQIQKYKIKLALFSKPYIFLQIIWIFLFILLNIYLNDLHIIGFSFFHYPLSFIIPYLLLLIFNSIFVSLNINLFLIKFQEVKLVSAKQSFFGVLGTFFALLTGACPGCVAGFFPAFVGLFGSTITLNSLPFNGLELQAISLLLLIIGTFYLSKDLTCKIKND